MHRHFVVFSLYTVCILHRLKWNIGDFDTVLVVFFQIHLTHAQTGSSFKTREWESFVYLLNNIEHRLFNISSRPRVAYILLRASMKSCGVGKVKLFFYYSYCCFLHILPLFVCVGFSLVSNETKWTNDRSLYFSPDDIFCQPKCWPGYRQAT